MWESEREDKEVVSASHFSMKPIASNEKKNLGVQNNLRECCSQLKILSGYQDEVQGNAKLTSLNTSKKQLHMEQFLLKTTILSLAEQFYNQDWKRDAHRIW